MEKVKMPHAEHDAHLCYLENIGYLSDHMDEYKKLVTDASFVCRHCGRSAAK
jgi:hypothetical protein